MSEATRLPLLLFGAFHQLRVAGIPLGVRDYLDGVSALTSYGGLEPFVLLRGAEPLEPSAALTQSARSKTTADNAPRREALIWLCETLWARTPHERFLVRRALTDGIPAPPVGLSARWLSNRLVHAQRPAQFIEPPRCYPADEPPPPSIADQEAAASSAGAEREPLAPEPPSPPGPIGAELAREGGMPIVELADAIVGGRRWNVRAPDAISITWMNAVWRRYLVPVGKDDSRDVDVDATVAKAIRTGALTAPVMRRRRVNTATLTVLLDTGTAMAPWRSTLDTIERSLSPDRSRLRRVTIRYFSISPGDTLFETATLHRGVAADELLVKTGGGPMLILGEAGASRERAFSNRRQRLDRFFASANNLRARPIVWLNPMPKRFWPGTLMEHLAKQRGLHLLELTPEDLLRAVDLLRGVAS